MMAPMEETQHEALAAHFGECARMLREHPELFDARAIAHVGVVAGLATRVVRLAARGHTTVQVFREVGGTLLAAIARGPAKGDRVALGLLAGARRGFVRAADRALALEARRHPRYELHAGDGGAPEIVSPCPRCGATARRDLRAPEPCAGCGFVFAEV